MEVVVEGESGPVDGVCAPVGSNPKPPTLTNDLEHGGVVQGGVGASVVERQQLELFIMQADFWKPYNRGLH